MNYTPRPGSVAQRALAHLESLEEGAELTTSLLAEAIDTPALNLIPNLEAAVKHGAVFWRQKDEHPRSPLFWSLVDHSIKPPPSPAQAAKRPQAEPANTELASPRRNVNPDPPAILCVGKQSAVDHTCASKLRIALWSDGTLEIRRSVIEFTETLRLQADETRELCAYLDRLGGNQ